MSFSVLLAAAAGICAAAAIADWLAAPRRCRRPATVPEGGHLGGMTVLLARLARRAGALGGPARGAGLEARLAAAGSPLRFDPADVMALKMAVALIGLLLAAPVAAALPGRLGLVAAACAPVAGFAAPDVWLARRARARAARIADELADVLDLLRVAIQAGLPLGRALGEVGRRMGGLLAAELRDAASRIELGETRAAALATLRSRCPLDAVATLTAAIARADRHGAPLAPALAALAAQARAEHARRLHDEAARAAPKIQLVVALVLVPAVMLIVGAVMAQGLTSS